MKAIYPMVGQAGISSSFQFNLKNPNLFKGTFSGSWVFSSTGATPDGTSAYFDSNLQVNTNLSETSTTLSHYSRTNNVVSACDIGARNFGFSNPMGILSNFTSLTYAVWDDYAATTTGVNTAAFFIETKNSTTLKLFRNSTNIITATKTLVSLPTSNIILGAWQSNSGYQDFSNRQYAFASIGDGLTDTEAANFYTAVQRFQTTLGRQV